VRVSVAAEEHGFDLAGAAVFLSSEPLTPAKAERIVRAGVKIITGYGSVETGAIGLGCARRAHIDEVHLSMDAYALIDYPYSVPGLGVTVPAFNLTGLLDSAPKVMLNYQTDDYGILESRACGCGLEAYGYTTRLREIRSYSKLVGEGVTLIGNEMLRILEEVLPARIGGTPLDYQMMEEEDGQGLTRLVLLVSPRVEIRDQAEVIEIILDALGQSSPMGADVRTVWQRAETLRIERREPVVTARGKLLPLHIERNAVKT
jgi:phenylacetate-coenzyme A ligase PaaK-like adenylate-forming protein